MTELIKSATPYILLVGLMILTLCTREQHTSDAQPPNIKSIDTTAIEHSQALDEVAYKADQPTTER